MRDLHVRAGRLTQQPQLTILREMARAQLALLLAAATCAAAAVGPANSCCHLSAGCVTTPAAPNPCGDCTKSGFCESYRFHGSKIIDHEWGMALDSWMDPKVVPAAPGYGGEVYWKLCYSSDTMDKTSPAEFHRRCDQYNKTVTVAHNTLGPDTSGTLGRPDSLVGVTFGGFVRSLPLVH